VIRIICFCTCNNEGFVSNSARQQLPRVTRGYAVYRQLDESLPYLFRVKWQFSSQATRRERKTQAYCRTSGFSATEWRTKQGSSWSQLMTVITAKKPSTVSSLPRLNRRLLSPLKMTIANIVSVGNFIPVAVKIILFVFLLTLVRFPPHWRIYFILVISLNIKSQTREEI